MYMHGPEIGRTLIINLRKVQLSCPQRRQVSIVVIEYFNWITVRLVQINTMSFNSWSTSRPCSGDPQENTCMTYASAGVFLLGAGREGVVLQRLR